MSRMDRWGGTRRASVLRGALSIGLAAAMMLGGVPASAIAAGGSDTSSGTWGTCDWEIDSAGRLTVHGGKGADTPASNEAPWYDHREKIKSVAFESGVELPEDCSWLFYGCSELSTLDASGRGTQNVAMTAVGFMFFGCSSLIAPRSSGWDTQNVTSMQGMFDGCSSLESLDLSGWDTENVTSMRGMFDGCSSLESLDLSGWDTSSVKDAGSMFKSCSPSTMKVSSGYAIKSPDMFPKEESGKKWRSQTADVLYTRDEVASERSGVDDTYEQERVDLVDISGASVSNISDQSYTGKALTPKPEVKRRGKTLEEDTDYRLSYKDNTKAGTATVVITGRGDYEGEKTVTFKIVAKTFPDVPKDAWYADVVSRAAGLGFIGGYSDGKYGPNDRITRGQVAVALWNMAGGPEAGADAKDFSDVKDGDYFYRAVRWASSRGVASGYSNGKFGPNDNVTREQLAVMLANYAKKVAHKQASGAASDFESMSDHDKVSVWAAPAVGWCFKNKILSGSNGKVLPQGNATRAEAAKTVVALHDLLT